MTNKNDHMNMRSLTVWILRLVPALIMFQTLYFKFTGQPESVRLFTELGMEPWGRYGTGILELIAGILILIPRYTLYGAILGLMMMTGALFFHLTKLGVYFDGDALLFTYAVVTFVCCAILILAYRNQLFKQIKSR